MVNNASDEFLGKLAKLSKQERQVLELRCQGLDYNAISKKLFVSVSAVKQYMSRIYVKLGLDILPRAERTKVLYEIVCPLLQRENGKSGKITAGKDEVLIGEEIPEAQALMIPAYVEDMVDDDEYPIIQITTETKIKPPETKRKPPRIGPIVLLIGVVLGIVVSALAYFFILRPTLTVLTSASPTSTILPTGTLAPSPTLEISTQIPLVVEKIVVVTATPPPATQVPTFTALPQPTILFEDNFNQGLSNGWSIASGNPLFINGELTSDQNTWLIVGDNSWTDYMVQFSAQTAKCWYYDNWNAFGVRAQDTGNMIAFKWASCESELDIVKNGNWLTVPNSHVSKGDYGNVPITITITVQGGQFTFDINGERVSSLFNSDFSLGGIALRVGAQTQIDNFKVTAIQK